MIIKITKESLKKKIYIFLYCVFTISYGLISVGNTSANTTQSILISGPIEIIYCDFSSPDGIIWALALDFDPSMKKQDSNYSIIRLNKDKSSTQYKLSVPVGTIVTPYRAKNQIRFFKLINNRYLYIGMIQLNGTIHIVKFDTKHPEKKHETIKMVLKGDADAANIFVTDRGSLRFVGSENKLPFVVAWDTEKHTIFEKKGLGLSGIGKLKLSALLNNGYILLAFNNYQGDDAGTSFLALLDTKGEVVEKKKIQGLVVEIKPAGDASAIILIAHDQSGKDMESQALDKYLNVKSRYPVPEYFKLTDTAGQLISLNSTTLLSILIDRTPGSHSLAELETYSGSGSTTIGRIYNQQPGKLRGYNISSQLINKTLYVGTAIVGIGPSNKGNKTYQFQSFTVH